MIDSNLGLGLILLMILIGLAILVSSIIFIIKGEKKQRLWSSVALLVLIVVLIIVNIPLKNSLNRNIGEKNQINTDSAYVEIKECGMKLKSTEEYEVVKDPNSSGGTFQNIAYVRYRIQLKDMDSVKLIPGDYNSYTRPDYLFACAKKGIEYQDFGPNTIWDKVVHYLAESEMDKEINLDLKAESVRFIHPEQKKLITESLSTACCDQITHLFVYGSDEYFILTDRTANADRYIKEIVLD
ncbi:MAG: hypothetical protein OHK0017_06280 [Patescibacteria group bacterium]